MAIVNVEKGGHAKKEKKRGKNACHKKQAICITPNDVNCQYAHQSETGVRFHGYLIGVGILRSQASTEINKKGGVSWTPAMQARNPQT